MAVTSENEIMTNESSNRDQESNLEAGNSIEPVTILASDLRSRRGVPVAQNPLIPLLRRINMRPFFRNLQAMEPWQKGLITAGLLVWSYSNFSAIRSLAKKNKSETDENVAFAQAGIMAFSNLLIAGSILHRYLKSLQNRPEGTVASQTDLREDHDMMIDRELDNLAVVPQRTQSSNSLNTSLNRNQRDVTATNAVNTRNRSLSF